MGWGSLFNTLWIEEYSFLKDWGFKIHTVCYRCSLRERIWVWKLNGQNFPFKQLVKLSHWARICVMMHLVTPLVGVWVAWDGVGDLCSEGSKDVPMSRDFWNYCGMFSFGLFCLVLLAGHIGTVYIFTELEKREQVSGVRVSLLLTSRILWWQKLKHYACVCNFHLGVSIFFRIFHSRGGEMKAR